MHILYWYILASYLIGIMLFVAEIYVMDRFLAAARKIYDVPGFNKKYLSRNRYIIIAVCVFSLSPLTIWFGILHYINIISQKLTGRKLF